MSPKILPLFNKTRWCSYCRQGNHTRCYGIRRLGHGHKAKCECDVCQKRRRESA